jgi:hypothetical protein
MVVIDRTKTLRASRTASTRKSDPFVRLDSVTGEKIDRQQSLDVETGGGNAAAAAAAAAAATKGTGRSVKFQLPDNDSDAGDDTPFSTARTFNKLALRSSRSMRRLGHTFGRSVHSFASRKFGSQRYSLVDVMSAEVEAQQLQQEQQEAAAGKCVSSAPDAMLPPMFSVVEEPEGEGNGSGNGSTSKHGKDTKGTAAAAEEGEVRADVVRAAAANGQQAMGAPNVKYSSDMTEALSAGPFRDAAVEPFGSDTCNSSKQEQQAKEEKASAAAAAGTAAGMSSAVGSKRAATVSSSSAFVAPKRVSFMKREWRCSDRVLAS